MAVFQPGISRDPGRNGDRVEFKVVGRTDIPAIYSPHLCSGAAKRSCDFTFPDMLFGKVLRSPYSHARIRSMDTSAAEALPGVKAVIRWDDPEVKVMDERGNKTRSLGVIGGPYMAMCYNGVPFLGNLAVREDDEVGVCVAAESEEICDEALKLIAKTIDWEILPHVIDCVEANQAGAPLARQDLNPNNNLWREFIDEKGDVAEAFTRAPHIVEYDLTFPQMCNYYPEPLTIASYWKQDDNHAVGETLHMTGLDLRRYVPESARRCFGLNIEDMHFLNTFQHSLY